MNPGWSRHSFLTRDRPGSTRGYSQLARVLIGKQKEFNLVVYPVEDHGSYEILTGRDSYRRMTDFFGRNSDGGSGGIRPTTDPR